MKIHFFFEHQIFIDPVKKTISLMKQVVVRPELSIGIDIITVDWLANFGGLLFPLFRYWYSNMSSTYHDRAIA